MSIIQANTVQIHYSFNEDEIHLMDAFIQNKCEREFLHILSEVANCFSLEYTIETEPFAEGGFRRWFKVITKEENKRAHITTAIIVALSTAIITTPIGKLSEKLIDKVFEDTELKELEKEKLKLEILKLKEETKQYESNLNKAPTVKKKKSNFYEHLVKYPRIKEVSFQIESDNQQTEEEEKTIPKGRFYEFILASDELEPHEKEEASIEIISPVLKSGHYKWSGIYDGIPISFHMKSKEFKVLVQSGKVEFKNGSSIICHLKVKRKMDQEGIPQNYSYEVLTVSKYFENDTPIETPEGKRTRRRKEAEKSQMNLFAQNK